MKSGWFFEKNSKIYKPPVTLTKKKREVIPINQITNERGEITTNTQKYNYMRIL